MHKRATRRWGRRVDIRPQKLRVLKDGRGDRIRTCDPLTPSQVRYQTALLPESGAVVLDWCARGNPLFTVRRWNRLDSSRLGTPESGGAAG